ncbi:transporter [Mobilicoccus massiliensis]|uniref:transporter n=1 Tax=Mobilicoccus massiliensis TaxID=1522310 RepID=UPI00058FD3C1|nr:transporter [Mobilicoccus massiliensis]
MSPALAVVLSIAVVLLGIAVLAGLVRVATATDDASRAVVGDLVYFSAVGVLAVFGTAVHSAVVDDAVMIAALLGILATVSLSRIITRGRR